MIALDPHAADARTALTNAARILANDTATDLTINRVRAWIAIANGHIALGDQASAWAQLTASRPGRRRYGWGLRRG